jgi:hypothetical protein
MIRNDEPSRNDCNGVPSMVAESHTLLDLGHQVHDTKIHHLWAPPDRGVRRVDVIRREVL